MFPVIFLLLIGFCKCQFPEVHYVVNIDSQVEVCDVESLAYVDTSGVTVRRYNETVAYMFGDIKFLQDINDDTMVEIILNKEVSGKYELMFSHEVCDFCAEVQKGPDSDYYGYMKYIGTPDNCPFPAGDYPIKEFVVDTDDLPVNSNTAGRYEAFIIVSKNPDKDCKTKEKMYCLTLKLLIEIA